MGVLPSQLSKIPGVGGGGFPPYDAVDSFLGVGQSATMLPNKSYILTCSCGGSYPNPTLTFPATPVDGDEVGIVAAPQYAQVDTNGRTVGKPNGSGVSGLQTIGTLDGPAVWRFFALANAWLPVMGRST
jgi:hypothetical protein